MNKNIILNLIRAKKIYDETCKNEYALRQTGYDTIRALNKEAYQQYAYTDLYTKLDKAQFRADCSKGLLKAAFYHEKVVDCGYCWDYEEDWYKEDVHKIVKPMIEKLDEAITGIKDYMASIRQPYYDEIKSTIDNINKEIATANKLVDMAKTVYDEASKKFFEEFKKEPIKVFLDKLLVKFKQINKQNIYHVSPQSENGQIVLNVDFVGDAIGVRDDDRYYSNPLDNAADAALDECTEFEEYLDELKEEGSEYPIEYTSETDEPELTNYHYDNDEKVNDEAVASYSITLKFNI